MKRIDIDGVLFNKLRKGASRKKDKENSIEKSIEKK